MVDTSTKTTDIGKSNFQGTISAGVIDRSKAMETEANFNALAKAGAQGIETYTAYDKNKTLSGVAEQIGGVISEQQDRSFSGQAGLEADIAAGQTGLKTMQANAGYDSTYPQVLNQELSDNTRGIQNSLAEKTDRLTNAKQQGIMGDLELKERLAKITREAISANPAYANEIISHVSSVASLNNLTARVAADITIAKDQKTDADARKKEIRSLADGFSISIDSPEYFTDGALDYDKVSQAVAIKQQKKSTYEEYTQSHKSNTAVQGLNAQQLIASGAPQLLNESIFDAVDAQVQNIINDTTIPAPQKQLNIRRLIAREQVDMRKWYLQNGVNPDGDDVKGYVSSFNENVKAIQEIYEGVADSSIISKATKNQLDTIVTQAQVEFYKKNPSSVLVITNAEITNKFSPLAGGQKVMINAQKGVVQALVGFKSDVTSTENKEVDVAFTPITTMKGTSPASLTTMNILDRQLGPKADAESKAILENQLEKRVLYTQRNDVKFAKEETASLIKDLADPRFESGMSFITNPELVSNLSSAVDAYKPALKNAVTKFKELFPDAQLTIRENDGMMFIKNAKPEHQSFMRNELRSINETLKAHLNVNRLPSNGKNANDYFADILGVPQENKP